jgi:hypothetical protein
MAALNNGGGRHLERERERGGGVAERQLEKKRREQCDVHAME